jgi:LemA protein
MIRTSSVPAPARSGWLRRRLTAALLVIGALAAGGPTGCGYNRIQQLDEQASQSQRQIEVQLKRRADLIPNLVATVRGFAAQEQAILTRVADAQRGLTGALGRPGGANPGELAQANDNLSRALVPVFTLVQSYPQLQSNQQFLQLQDELTGTENRIAVARTDYNGAVREYNTLIRTFPTAVTARATGAKPREYFEITNAGDREVPTVNFDAPAAAPPAAAPPAATAPGTTPPAAGPSAPPPARQ